jgi:hypothetical protein
VSLRTSVDHLVVAAATLDEGLAWCRQTFGFEPASGGDHALMGTHNRVFRIDSAAFPRAYLEIIAANPKAPPHGRTRWFDLDDPRLQRTLATGPRLVHFVAATNDAQEALGVLTSHGIDRGVLLAAERTTPAGILRWKISVREDGRRLFDGTLPTLIEWGGTHPCDSLPASGIRLQSLQAMLPEARELRAAYESIGLGQVGVDEGPPNLVALLATAAGAVRLESAGA